MRHLLRTLTFGCLLTAAVSCMGGKGGYRGSAVSGTQTPPGNQHPESASAETTQDSDAGQPQSGERKLTAAGHPVINVYIENSGSMNGYVDQGKSGFQQTVHNYLCDLGISGIPSEMNTFFINSQIVPKGNDVSTFINKLTPKDFRQSSGQKGTTDIAEVFSQILSKTDGNNVSILISDCIFSPGNVKDPQAYLTSQMIDVKKAFAKHISHQQNLAVMVYRMTSNFKGTYYDCFNRPRQYQGERPYYIWIIGNLVNISQMRLQVPDSKFIGGVKNYWCCFTAFPSETEYNVLLNPKKGDFQLKSRNCLTKTKADGNGDFMFTIGADLSGFAALLGADYVEDTDNYVRIVDREVQESMSIEIKKNAIPRSPATHLISLTTKGVPQKGELQIALRCNVPDWAYEYSDVDDTSFTPENESKTYGLHYLFDGIFQAFTAKTDNHYLTMNFSIN